MQKALVFEVWGSYAHYKKIYATTTAVSYLIPPKTSIYGYIAAIIGLDKTNNAYLNHFKAGSCHISMQLMRPIVMQRVNTNLRQGLGRMKETDNRKPTMIEYVYKPKYRIFFTHTDEELYRKLQQQLQAHQSVYTPTLGLAGLISNFAYVGEFEVVGVNRAETVFIHSIIPKSKFLGFDIDDSFSGQNEIVEISQYAVEMDSERNVTLREDVLIDRKAKAIKANVSGYSCITVANEPLNIILF